MVLINLIHESTYLCTGLQNDIPEPEEPVVIDQGFAYYKLYVSRRGTYQHDHIGDSNDPSTFSPAQKR